MKEEIDRRDIGGGMHHAIQIQEEICSLREELFQVRTGFVLNNSEERIEGGEDSSSPTEFRRPTTLHSYDGRFNILPNNYQILSLTLASFIAIYLLGLANKGIPVKTIDMKGLKKDGKVNAKILT